MMRWCAIGFVAGIAASIGWHLAPHGAHSQPIVPVAIAAPAASAVSPAPTFDVAPLVVTTAAPTAETVVAGFAHARAPKVVAPRAPVVVKRSPAPPAAVVPAAPVAPAPAVKDDELARARQDYAAASAELGAAL